MINCIKYKKKVHCSPQMFTHLFSIFKKNIKKANPAEYDTQDLNVFIWIM